MDVTTEVHQYTMNFFFVLDAKVIFFKKISQKKFFQFFSSELFFFEFFYKKLTKKLLKQKKISCAKIDHRDTLLRSTVD